MQHSLKKQRKVPGLSRCGTSAGSSGSVGAKMSLPDRTRSSSSPTARVRSHGWWARCAGTAARRAHRPPGLGAGIASATVGGKGGAVRPSHWCNLLRYTSWNGRPRRFELACVGHSAGWLPVCSLQMANRIRLPVPRSYHPN